MAQTKFVLRKAIAAQLRPLVVLNKVDRDSARIDETVNDIFDTMVALGVRGRTRRAGALGLRVCARRAGARRQPATPLPSGAAGSRRGGAHVGGACAVPGGTPAVAVRAPSPLPMLAPPTRPPRHCALRALTRARAPCAAARTPHPPPPPPALARRPLTLSSTFRSCTPQARRAGRRRSRPARRGGARGTRGGWHRCSTGSSRTCRRRTRTRRRRSPWCARARSRRGVCVRARARHRRPAACAALAGIGRRRGRLRTPPLPHPPRRW